MMCAILLIWKQTRELVTFPTVRRCSFQTAMHTVVVNPGGAFHPKENPRNGATEPSRPSGTLDSGIIKFTLAVSC